MNDRYLYRGKRVDTGEWVEGSLVTGVFFRLGQEIPYMFCPNLADYDCFEDFSEENGIFEVDPSTICQCTGLRGKNGKMIWENDILMAYLDEDHLEDVTYAKVEWNGFGWIIQENNSEDQEDLDDFVMKNYEVCGNTIDNPKLLEELRWKD